MSKTEKNRKGFGQKIIKGLKGLLKDIKTGKPVKVTELTKKNGKIHRKVSKVPANKLGKSRKG